jgi:AcrR family transcriptional regulator
MAAGDQRERARLGRAESQARIVAAATSLIRERGFAQLSIGEIMERAEIGRTIFYRHFDDLGDLLLKASRDAIGELYVSELELDATQNGFSPEIVDAAIEPAVAIYRRHGPLLLALAEAAPGDPRIAGAQEAIRVRFDELVASALGRLRGYANRPEAELVEIARALNLLNTSYLLDAFGREPRVTGAEALDTLREIWTAVIERGAGPPPPA